MTDHKQKFRVLVVDDSVSTQRILVKAISDHPNLEVVGVAGDPYVARDLIVNLKPDVITLDLQMPRMDGLTFLKKLMRHYPLPVVVVSSLTADDADLALEAVHCGAVDVVSKPNNSYQFYEFANQLVDKLLAASLVDVGRSRTSHVPQVTEQPKPLTLTRSAKKIIAIGTSTGGTEALRQVLPRLPDNTPGIVMVQHMPEHFTHSLANSLDTICSLTVKEAKNGDRVATGLALLAPGNHHMALRCHRGELYVEITHSPPVNRHRPSIDVLFQSVAAHGGAQAIGVIMTGMGRDGAKGLLAMKNSGATTIGQDKATSVVFGMPKVAAQLGAVDHTVGLPQISEAIVGLCQGSYKNKSQRR